jgi:hypothetical protein
MVRDTEPDFDLHPDTWREWAIEQLMEYRVKLHAEEQKAKDAVEREQKRHDELIQSRRDQQRLQNALTAAEEWAAFRKEAGVPSMAPTDEVQIPAIGLNGHIEEVLIKYPKRVYYRVYYWNARKEYCHATLHESEVRPAGTLELPRRDGHVS